jgi:nickel/cobalt exporter
VRRAFALGLAVAGVLLGATSASAHPLGNFSTSHLTEVRVSADRVDLRYVVDQAEIPTVRERGDAPATVLARKRAEAHRGLRLTVDGRQVPLRLDPGGRIAFPQGQGGLRTTRVELHLSAPVDGPRRVEVRDDTFPGRVGWRSVVTRPGDGTAVRSSVPSEDVTRGLHAYPADLLRSPLDVRAATLSVRPGDGTLVAPRAEGAGDVTTRNRSGDGFAGLFENAAAGQGVLLLLLLAAFGWGGVHALSPGHGKAMVAAYLVGTRGTARQAIALGATVTVTHTIGVFALGFVTLALSQFFVPEDLYPWLTLVSGLLVVGVGAGVLRARVRAQARHHHHGDHDHHHDAPAGGWKGLIGMGASAGLIPCPSALVVLLGALSQHEVALGLLLIVAFSAGLAATLTALGLAVVYARRLTAHVPFGGRVARRLPALSAAAIVVVGGILTAQALPAVL